MTTTSLLELPDEQLTIHPSTELMVAPNSTSNSFDNEDAARRYDRAIDALPYFKDTIKRLVEYADIQSTDKVVDLACGTGYSTRFILEKAPAKVYGVDSARAMLEYASKKFGGRVRLLHGMAESLDMLIDEKVDKVISTFGFSYFVDPEKVIRGVYNALAPNGSFVFNVAISSDGKIVATHEFDKVFYRELSRLLREKLGEEVPQTEAPNIKVTKYTREELTGLLEAAGFKVRKYDEIECKITPEQLKNSYLSTALDDMPQETKEIFEEAIENAIEETKEDLVDGYYISMFALIEAVKDGKEECNGESNDVASSEGSCSD